MNKIRRIVRVEEVPSQGNAETTGNPEDQGRWKSLIGKESGSKDLALGIGWLKPGEVHLLHHHEKTSEFYYVLEGSGRVTVAGEEVEVGPGTVIYIPAGDKQRIMNNGDKELVVLFGYNHTDWGNIWDE